jgi:DNA-binding ferritin-like protein
VSPRLYERIGRMGDDPGTQDLLIGTVRLIDQQMWMLRAHTM